MSQVDTKRRRHFPKAQVVHHLPGRLRLKLPHAKGNYELLEEIKLTVSAAEGVTQVDVNPTTGSILIQYDQTEQPELHKQLQRAEAQVAFALEIVRISSNGKNGSLESFVKQLRENIKRETGDAVDLKQFFPASIALYDLLFVKRSRPTPLWLTLLMFSFSSYMDLNRIDPQQQIDKSLEALRTEIAALRKEVQSIAKK